MTISIGLIKWPENKELSIRLYLGFLLEVVKLLDVKFDGYCNDPIEIIRGYLNGTMTEYDRELALSYWWERVDDENIRNFKDKSLLMSRLAICFLSIKEKDVTEIGEHLSWAIEVLGLLKLNVSDVINLMGEYFEFNGS